MIMGDFSGEGQPKLELYEEKIPLFSSFYAESKLEKALSQKVWLKSGGYLVIEETEACVVIDVNSAKAAGRGDLEKMILKTNLEAAEEAAKQIFRGLDGGEDAQGNKNHFCGNHLSEGFGKSRCQTTSGVPFQWFCRGNGAHLRRGSADRKC